VAEHAGAARASVFADCDQGEVIVTVRDDGAGFTYDEAELAARGKLGLLKSMKGRVEQLGGAMRVDTSPGAGTEIEFRVPRPNGPRPA
jgi:signal transduction histidine kinase